MSNNRRDFIKKSFIAGTGLSLLSQSNFAGSFFKIATPDISVVNGTDMFSATIRAIEQFGGINKAIPKGAKTGILINAPGHWTKPGSYTHTDVVLATLKMLNDAGINDITFLLDVSSDFYKRSSLSPQYEYLTKTIKKSSGNYKEVQIPKGVALKKANVIEDLFNLDAFINIPINKHHSGVNYTGCLKNMMGACNRDTNMKFHKPGKNDGEDGEFLSQCIADLNLVRKPDLCIMDASEVLRTNGPFGPGEIAKINKVFVGSDPVMMDTYGCTLLDNRPEDILMLEMARAHGLGRTDLKDFVIKESSL